MNYRETVKYLFECVPMFQNIGSGAYKEGLDTTRALDSRLGHPHEKYHTIHVGGTNGKGSCSHTIAAILASAGYKVGLFTSPHLVDFRERIRVDGEPVPEKFVVDFVKDHRDFFEPLHPSFFELTTALAFHYFDVMKVDVAVIEVGMGGRLDCTNIITPDISVITNISLDHTQFLGHTLAAVAGEKAGIIKPGVPTVIGEYVDETRPVFEGKAKEANAPIIFAQDEDNLIGWKNAEECGYIYQTKDFGEIHGQLGGISQLKNTKTILTALSILKEQGYNINTENVAQGFSNVCGLTGLMGRWQQLSRHPRAVCDTGHNVACFEDITRQIANIDCDKLRMVFGMVGDKDIDGVLSLLPCDAEYYFCKADIVRAMPEEEMQTKAAAHGLKGRCFDSVAEAYKAAISESSENDFVFVGGSSFVVADLLASIMK